MMSTMNVGEKMRRRGRGLAARLNMPSLGNEVVDFSGIQYM